MGLDFGQIISNAGGDIKAGMSDVLQQGGNAGLGYLEQQAINILTADKADKEKAFQEGVIKAIQSPSKGDGVGAYLQNLLQAPVLKQYGPTLLIGVGVIALIAILAKGNS